MRKMNKKKKKGKIKQTSHIRFSSLVRSRAGRVRADGLGRSHVSHSLFSFAFVCLSASSYSGFPSGADSIAATTADRTRIKPLSADSDTNRPSHDCDTLCLHRAVPTRCRGRGTSRHQGPHECISSDDSSDDNNEKGKRKAFKKKEGATRYDVCSAPDSGPHLNAGSATRDNGESQSVILARLCP